MTERPELRAHLDPATFAEAIRFTAARRGFAARLVEKDYFCTLVLEQLAGAGTLVFKGGTCLAKVHAGFYRLSEDLDFTIPVATDSTRGQRRTEIRPLKTLLATLDDRQAVLRVVEAMRGANDSTQYLATIAYASLVTGRAERIKIEVALREPLLMPPVAAEAATLLVDPVGGEPLVAGIRTSCIAFAEAFAEKFRAALTRREPAIRDYFDIDWAVRSGRLAASDPTLTSLIRAKLTVPGDAAAGASSQRLTALRRQLESDLRPVLRPPDFAAFDLDRAYAIVMDAAERVRAAG